MKKSKKNKTGRREPFAQRVSGKTLADHIQPPAKCSAMLTKLAKSKTGLPANVTRENSRMVSIMINGKVTRVNPNGIAQLWGLRHHGWLPYMDDKASVKSQAAKEQAALAKDGRLYHYRTLLLQLARAGYKVILSKGTDDKYLAGVVVKASKAAKAAKK